MHRKAKAQPLVLSGATAVALAAAAYFWLATDRPKAEDRTPTDAGKAIRAGREDFRECAAEVGLTFRMRFLPSEQGEKFKVNLYDHGCGVAVADYDGDGHDDIYFLNQLSPNALFQNQGDGTFEDATKRAGVALGDRVCVGATFADYDNDGDPDLYVTSTRGGNVLFQNQGDGTFTDVTKQAGLVHVGHSQAGVFFDYDNDGMLDLFLANTAHWTQDTYDEDQHYFVGKEDVGRVASSAREPNVFYRNNGDGTFTDVTAKVGLRGRGWAGDAVVFDYDEDGRLDLFVTSMFGRAQLYRNHPDGTFTDVTLDVLGRTPFGGLGAKAFDYNNDGRLDVFVVDMHSDMWTGLDGSWRSRAIAQEASTKKFGSMFGPSADGNPAYAKVELHWQEMLGYRKEEVVFGNAFYKNLGGGQFAEVSARANLETFWPWGIANGDFDNDGFEDVFVSSGMGFPFYYWPNALLMNNGNETFTNRAEQAGIEPPARGRYQEKSMRGIEVARSSRSAAVADFDGDGRLDLVVNNFNDRPYFFRNRFPPRNWIAFRLQGSRGNRDALGALVAVYTAAGVQVRQVHGACGYLAQSSRAVSFGLGEQAAVARVEIRWPGGRRQVVEAPAINRLHRLTEPEGK